MIVMEYEIPYPIRPKVRGKYENFVAQVTREDDGTMTVVFLLGKNSIAPASIVHNVRAEELGGFNSDVFKKLGELWNSEVPKYVLGGRR